MRKSSHLFQLSKVLASFIRKREILGYMPARLWVETTSRCNLKCGSCINRDLPVREKADMDWDLFKAIIDQAAGKIYDANLFHRGEPLLHKDIIKMISYASEKQIKTRIHTNATLLDRTISRDLIEAGLDFISFSFDSPDKEEYEKKRKGAGFDHTLNNIKTFLEIRKQLKMKKPATVIQLMEKNDRNRLPSSGYTQNLLKAFSELPPDRIILRKPHNWGGLLETQGSPAGTGTKRGTCTFPWYSLTIFSNGITVPCPQDFMGVMPVGDANNGPLEDIFNGQPLRDLRKMFSSGSIEEDLPCYNCDRIIRKTFMGIPLEYAGVFIRENFWTG